MGQVVTFSKLGYKDAATGVKTAPITGSLGKEMQAEVVRLAPGAKFTGTVPNGSDRYLYTLTGEASLEGDGASHPMPADTFATLQEDLEFSLTNTGTTEAEVISVLAPPAGSVHTLNGFQGGVATSHRSTVPVVAVPEQKKRRLYFVDKNAAPSARGHAMIVLYEKETVTGMHMHPNAESMFVILTGKVRFNVNGEDVVIGRGQAAHFPSGDRHGLRGEEGDVSFLEFHIPGAFTTVRG